MDDRGSVPIAVTVNNYYAPAPAVPESRPGANVEDPRGRTHAQVQRRSAWSWASIALGGLVIFGTLVAPQSFAYAVSGVLAGAGILLPGAWWRSCESKDRKALEQWEKRAETNAELKEMLRGGYDVVAWGMGSDPKPTPMDRRWALIAVVAVGLCILSGIISPM
ncbi:hypothetical protein [Corynebacterium liangguodongii]|uniref:Uncharacterized protein n=1 Tax=Corynebacterium liangguodongii TaxID=2079535 RepID=A0A2S0WFA3_9CORY|nr:hypothetical protein [Corynebacterium liangguodongii]AWB84436.1 hypothetical protein C3E79_08025 [Corynebacterium liangguodongii]PWB99925.1 hypothetical protein DF219_04620 [Corynebacterium liangguodongii]